ncbi:Uncharacterised protein [Klebsiella pneumoniae]|nr:Uncharacterised protein [Klebsiella pneumoniae]
MFAALGVFLDISAKYAKPPTVSVSPLLSRASNRVSRSTGLWSRYIWRNFCENDLVLTRVERFRLEDRQNLLSAFTAVVIQQKSAKYALLCFNAVRRVMKSEVITGPLARFGVDIDVQEVFQRLAAPGFPGALIRPILKHPAAVTGDVAQVRLPVSQGKAVAIKLTGNFCWLSARTSGIRLRRLSVRTLMPCASGNTW